MNISEMQRPIDISLVNEMIASTPDSWDEIVLDVLCDLDGNVQIEINGPSTSNERVGATATLAERALELADFLKRHGGTLRAAQYKASLRQDGAWAFNSTFSYY